MEHIQQLKKIRSDAISRIRNSPDFKLAGKLGLLIVELGDSVDDVVDYDDSKPSTPFPAAPFAATTDVSPPAHPFESTFAKPKEQAANDAKSDEMIDELVAEIEGDAAELDALAAADDKLKPVGRDKVGPFFAAEIKSKKLSNGAAH